MSVSVGVSMRVLRRLAVTFVFATLAVESAQAGPPYRTDDPEPVHYQHLEINAFSLGTRTSSGWSGILPSLEVNYGAVPNLQLHAIVPQGYATPGNGSLGFALGDVELGAKYRFINPGDNDWYPQVAIFPTVEIPTGNQQLSNGTGHAQFYLPLWLQKDFDPWTLYGGGGYWINPGAGNRNYAFFGVAALRRITDRFQAGIELFHQTSSAVTLPDSTGFNVGMNYDFSDNWHLLSSVGTGLENRSSTNEFSYYLALQLTF